MKELNINSEQKIELICQSAHDKKAEEIVIMEMRRKSAFCDYFVVMSASSSVRAKTIADSIEETLKGEDLRARHKEGYADGVWVLLDYGDVVVHIFSQESRKFYNLETLWGDAPKRLFVK